MDSTSSINVTRWVNESQAFVEVGTLFRSEIKERENPLIGFNYHPDYLENYSRLLPSVFENGEQGRTVLGGNQNKDMVPSYFKQFLPSERNKHLFNVINSDYHKLDQFQQIKYITQFRGVFGAVQLDYSDELQSNNLPSISEAIDLLERIENRQYDEINSPELSAMYHPNSDSHVVSTFIEMDESHVYCTLRKCETELEADKLLFTQSMLNECGIESSLAVKIGGVYVGQITGEQIIDKKNNKYAMYNCVPSSVLLADSKRISRFEVINFAHINHSINQVVNDLGAEVFKRALVSHLLGQKDMTSQHMKIKEVVGSGWVVAPQEIFPMRTHDDSPYSLPLSDTISAYTHVKVDQSLIDMVVDKYELTQEQVINVIREVAIGLEKIDKVAIDSSLRLGDIKDLKDSIIESNILHYIPSKQVDLNEQEDPTKGPLM